MPVTLVVAVEFKGGAGSGNWGHAGRPGMVGGSAPAAAGPSTSVFWSDKYPKSNMAAAGGMNDWEYYDSMRTLRKRAGGLEATISKERTGFRLTYPREVTAGITLPAVREVGPKELHVAMAYGDLMLTHVAGTWAETIQ